MPQFLLSSLYIFLGSYVGESFLPYGIKGLFVVFHVAYMAYVRFTGLLNEKDLKWDYCYKIHNTHQKQSQCIKVTVCFLILKNLNLKIFQTSKIKYFYNLSKYRLITL